MSDDTIYRQGNVMGKKGTILPRAAERGREHSGTVFDVNKPLEQNIVEIDGSGQQRVVHLDKEAVAKATEAARAGKQVDPTTLGKPVAAPVAPTYHRVEESPAVDNAVGQATTGLPFVIQDDSQPAVEESVALPPQNSEPVPKSGESGSIPPTPAPAAPSQAGASAPVAEAETQPVQQSSTCAVVEPPKPKAEIKAYEPVVEKPADLDKEPDATPGPERLSSYTVQRRTSEKDNVPPPLLTPQMEDAPVKPAPADETFQNTKDAESAPQSAYANLEARPMRKAKIKVRFKSAMGSLAVAYNVVFKEGIKLVMVQHDAEGLFYEPPGDNETPVEIQWHGKTYVCYSALNFKMPDEQTAFNIYLIDKDATKALQGESDGENG